MPKNDRVLVALDLGTSKITTLVANVTADGKIQYIGKGVSENKNGIVNGSVVNMEATSKAVSESIREAEKMADVNIKSVIMGFSGTHISSTNSDGVVTVRGREVAQTDIERVIEQAKNINLSSDRKIVGVELGGFKVDGQSGIKNPVGMAGKRLEVEVHVLTASIAMIQNLIKSVENSGLQVDEILFNGLASSYAVLDDEEKELGVSLIDIGKGTTDILVFKAGYPVFCSVLNLSGEIITRDISFGMKVPPNEAERIKCEYGSATQEAVSPDDELEVSLLGSDKKTVRKVQFLAGIVSPRVEEILLEIRKKINSSNIKDGILSSNIVLTGGTANLRFIEEKASDIFGIPVRIGKPKISEEDNMGFAEILSDSSFASVVGTIKYFAKHRPISIAEQKSGFFGKLGEFLRNFFE